jgi:hypothetical protein
MFGSAEATTTTTDPATADSTCILASYVESIPAQSGNGVASHYPLATYVPELGVCCALPPP